jgi:very-short-patch-repair endonuclease
MASAQRGVLTRAQLLGSGLSGTMIARWIRAGRLHRRHPRVYALGHRCIGPEAELIAALLYAGPGAALSHATAAWWWRLIDHRPLEIEFSAPGHVTSRRALRIHHPRRLDTARHQGLPVTTVAQTLLDFAAAAPEGRVRRALAEADYRRLLRPRDVGEALGRGHPGSANLRRAMTIHQPDLARSRSELEQGFLALCERHDVPRPQVNVVVAGCMVDALWLAQRVIVELDGAGNHTTSAQTHRDHERDFRLRALGYLILRYTYHQVTRRGPQVAGEIIAALLDRA